EQASCLLLWNRHLACCCGTGILPVAVEQASCLLLTGGQDAHPTRKFNLCPMPKSISPDRGILPAEKVL
ncbi:hypothetical protein, partial [Microcoleus sp. D3_18a_C4]